MACYWPDATWHPNPADDEYCEMKLLTFSFLIEFSVYKRFEIKSRYTWMRWNEKKKKIIKMNFVLKWENGDSGEPETKENGTHEQ